MIRGAGSANVPDSSLTRIRNGYAVDRPAERGPYLPESAATMQTHSIPPPTMWRTTPGRPLECAHHTGVTDPNYSRLPSQGDQDSLAANKAKAPPRNSATPSPRYRKPTSGTSATNPSPHSSTNLASLPSATCDAVKTRLNNVFNRGGYGTVAAHGSDRLQGDPESTAARTREHAKQYRRRFAGRDDNQTNAVVEEI